MSVSTPEANELFRLSIMKYLSANPSERWVNSYEFRVRSGSTATTATLLAFMSDVVLFEKALHLTSVGFERAIISTWVAEGGYDPSGFLSQDLDGGGEVAVSGDTLSLEHVLKVRRDVLAGRYGNVFLRGALLESDVQAPSGVLRLATINAIRVRLSAAVADDLADYMSAGTGLVELVMAGVNRQAVLHVRPIVDFSVGGVGLAKVSRRYFNRSA